ncbi:hypothetical protein Q7P37_003905 [Cladosporium fusiforme]
MNPNPAEPYPAGLERAPSHGYASSGSEQPKKSGSSAKKRASRAGTRSVSTLSAAQLERKRANDREAQRAIRQRTKDHIDGLENTISELRRSQDASEKIASAARQRSRELEEENAYMRMKLSEAGMAIDLPQPCKFRNFAMRITKGSTQLTRSSASRQDPSLLTAHASSPATQASGASIQRPASTSTSRSFSGTHPGASGSWHQQQQQQPSHIPRGSYSGLANLPLAVPGSAAIPPQSGLTTWRSHDSTQTVPSIAGDIHPPARNASLPYNAPSHSERPQWQATTSQYSYPVSEQQPQTQYQAHPQQHSPYAQTTIHTYAQAQHPPQQQPAYHPPQMPPQTEFQNLSVSGSPASYSVSAPVTQGFVQNQTYQVAPMQTTEYQQHQAQVPPHLPAPSYHATATEQAYSAPPPAQQQAHQQPSVHYRDDSGRGYPLSHYPSA